MTGLTMIDVTIGGACGKAPARKSLPDKREITDRAGVESDCNLNLSSKATYKPYDFGVVSTCHDTAHFSTRLPKREKTRAAPFSQAAVM